MDPLLSKTTITGENYKKKKKKKDLVFLTCPKGIQKMEKYLFKKFH